MNRIDGAGQRAIAEIVESLTQSEQGVRENGVELNIGFVDAEAGFEGGKLG